MTPLITVVTVCYNSEKTIRKTIESVLNQDLADVEYLIIDGASTDNTLNVINTYYDRFGGSLSVISEPDKGWYDAMNKAIRIATGDFIVFLNSDDYFAEDALRTVKKTITDYNINNGSIIYGDSTNIYRNTKGEVLFRTISAPDYIMKNDKRLRNGMCGIRHQSMFTGKAVFKTVGELDLQYRLHADWDFLVKCVQQEVPMHHIPKTLTYYSMYGVSTNPNYEERHLLRRNDELYNTVDWNYVKDRWGMKVVAKKIMGVNKWNDLLFFLHKKRVSIKG